jgi:hypothetical protein
MLRGSIRARAHRAAEVKAAKTDNASPLHGGITLTRLRGSGGGPRLIARALAMWSEQTWLLIVTTWIAIVVGGIVFAIIEEHKRKRK